MEKTRHQQTARRARMWLVLIWIAVVAFAGFLRIWKLNDVPAGLHQDEAWFSYNAFLLKTTGINIYGQRFPLTVDMWGDYVSSSHSFAIIPFITLFGMNTAAFRMPFAVAALICLLLGSWLLYRWTASRLILLGFAILFATSQWNIIMSRASSTVVLDSMVTLITLAVFYEGLRWLQERKQLRYLVCWFLVTYALTIISYFTYFTSRLTLPVFLAAVLWLAWVLYRIEKRLVIAGALVIVAYLIFPFAIMLKTPYALGRYKETTILNGPQVRNQLFLDISRSGQAGLPPLVTRMFFNKVTENVRAVIVQYLAFVSPSIVLFQTAPPARYFVPQSGVMNPTEYIGLVLVLASLVLVTHKQHRGLRAISLVTIIMSAIALLPTALTVDDWPNFQRGVYVTPFLQMAAAVGLGITAAQIFNAEKTRRQKMSRVLFFTLAVGGVLVAFIPFTVHYFAQSKYANVFYRSRPGEKLGQWINTEAHDDVILMDHDEANFIYPYIYAQENVLKIGLESPEKYVLKASEFRIGKRYYVHQLCDRSDFPQLLSNIQPTVIIVKKDPPQTICPIPENYTFVKNFAYDDGTVKYAAYRRTSDSP